MILTQERNSILQAVLDSPHEDNAPRLIYADFLEEYGNEDEQFYAEFIRAQIELASNPHDEVGCKVTGICDACSRQVALAQRSRELLIILGGKWTPNGWERILSPRWK